jgi:hypothetical protein
MFLELLDAPDDDAGNERPFFDRIDRKADLRKHLRNFLRIGGQIDILTQPG